MLLPEFLRTIDPPRSQWVQFACERCGSSFRARLRPGKPPPRYCSRLCYRPDQNTPNSTCENCGAAFRIAPSAKQSGRGRCCSRRCFDAVQPSTEERFWQSVRKSDGCWVWTAANTKGYGVLGEGSKLLIAHRYSYELHYGTNPGELAVCHTCDNPSCVRPDHLFLGTKADNNADMARKGRSCRGEARQNHRLREADVRLIRCLIAAGVSTYAGVARQFSVSESLIRGIAKRQRWKWLK